MMSEQLCTNCNGPLTLHKGQQRAICNECKRARQFQRWSHDPYKFLRDVAVNAKYRAKKRDIVWDIDSEWVCSLWDKQKGRCALSGIQLTHHRGTQEYVDTNASLDRIRCHEGYTKFNTQLVAFRINSMKSDMEEAQFVWWVKTLNSFMDDRISQTNI